MENMDDEYRNYWETNMFLLTEELDSYYDESVCNDYNSSSPDLSSTKSNNHGVVSERNRRKKLNERLCALRSVVPNITKMDKASTIRDAIEYIKSLRSEEMRIQAEISELERGTTSSSSSSNSANVDHHHNNNDNDNNNNQRKRTKIVHCAHDPIQLRVSKIGDKTIVVSLECMNSERDTMIKLYKAFESLNLKIITCNINALSGRLFTTVFLEDDEDDKDDLRVKIEDAIAALN